MEEMMMLLPTIIPGAILIMLVILSFILSANLRQIRSINHKLETTLEKAEQYFSYILEDEADMPPANDVRQEYMAMEEAKREEMQKRQEASLISEVLMEYFP